MACGIYKYENKINHKIYIGQSVDIKKRIREHRNAAFNINNKDYNMVIHKAIRKYGENNFQIDILEECLKEELNDKESYWIKYYDGYKQGYNATEGGDESHIHLGEPVELYDLKGNYVKEYSNAIEAAKALGVTKNTIYGILYGDRLSTKGYQIKRKKDKKEIKPYKSRQGGKIPVLQYTKNNMFIKEWESAAKAARELNLDSSTICKCLKGKLKTHGGFIWKYKERGDDLSNMQA